MKMDGLTGLDLFGQVWTGLDGLGRVWTSLDETYGTAQGDGGQEGMGGKVGYVNWYVA